MQTKLTEAILATEEGKEADDILRSCVHCGFCSATCPTYQVFGDELDSPRGRIYQIKRVLEGGEPTANTLLHLDRCLLCLNCESTCPSGVQYHRLLDYGRFQVAQKVRHPLMMRFKRFMLRKIFPFPKRAGFILGLARLMRPLLPRVLKRKIPARVRVDSRDTGGLHTRKVLLFDGCVQDNMTPRTNAATVDVLDQLGIGVIRVTQAGCCGAIDQHMQQPEAAKVFMRRNIDAWWAHVEKDTDNRIEAIVITASGCSAMIKDYAHHLKHDPVYGPRAEKLAALVKDLSEVIKPDDITRLEGYTTRRIAFHPPCTLQHGQKLQGVVEALLSRAGFELVAFDEPHLCCGSAGTYSILHPGTSMQLRDRKLANLQARQPELIATANIGCQMHLQSGSDLQVVHWIELLQKS